ncbi:ribonuclease H-like domain-containing protein [Boletus edulis]|nr:ribonuclease H-like domain-containing protein [Boletus edulis]
MSTHPRSSLTTTRADCEAQVKGFTGALYKKLSTEAEAVEFMSAKPSTTQTSTSRDSAPIASTTKNVHTRPVGATPEDEKDCDIVYCDGACKGNGQPGSVAGIGVWWGHGDPRNIAERCPGGQTNNRAELIAIVRILETTPRLKRRLLIKTDSKYSIQCVTSWIFNWMRNGFLAADGKPVKNRALIRYLAALLHVRRKTSQTGNEAADQLANLGATKATVSNLLKPIKVVDDDLKVTSAT